MSTRTYPRHAATLAWAVREEGVSEDPPGSNTGARVRFYQGHTWLAGTGWAWCAAFVESAAQEGGGFKFPEATAGAWDLLDRSRPRGWTLLPSNWANVLPGDFAVFNVGAGHVAVVKSVTASVVTTVDGNSSDMVRENTRPLSVVRGFVHWPESPSIAGADTVLVPPAKPPRTQIVTGESGSRRLVHAKTGVSVELPRVDVTVDGRLRNTGQRPDNPALLKRIALFVKTAKVVTVSRSKTT